MSNWKKVKIGDFSVTAAESFRRLESSFAIQVVKFLFEKTLDKNSVLGDFISEIKTGKTPSKNEFKYYEDKFISWFKPNEIGHKLYLEDSENYLSKHAVDLKQVTIFKPKTLLINCIGDVGRMGILNKESSSNQQITGVLFNEKVLPEYAFLYLLSHRNNFYEGILKTTLPIINQNKLKKLPFCCISIDEQKKIIDFIFFLLNVQSKGEIEGYEINEKIKSIAIKFFLVAQAKEKICLNSSSQKYNLTHLRQQILQDAISGELTTDWRDQNPDVEPASKLLEQIKAEKEKLIAEKKIKKEKPFPPVLEEEIPFELPESWEWCRLGDAGFTQTGTTPPTQDKNNFGEDIPFIKPADIKVTWEIDYENEKLSNKGLKLGRLIESGSAMMVCIGGSIGKSGICSMDVSCNQQINTITPLADTNSWYIQFLLQSPYFQKTVWSRASGGTTPIVNKTKWETIPFPLPPKAEQKVITSKVEKLVKLVNQLEKKITENEQNADLLMQAFLAEAFTQPVAD